MKTKVRPAPTAEQKRFAKLSKQRQRIEIAKDVIKLLTVEKIMQARSGNGYVEPRAWRRSKSEIDTSSMDAGINDCYVCAIGGLFLSAVRLKNRVTLEWAFRRAGLYEMRNFLDCFGTYDLYLIEKAFENAFTWSDIRNANDRLMAICQNIVDHGEFRPEAEYEIQKG